MKKMKLNIQLFAGGTINGTWDKGTGGSGKCHCKIDWWSEVQGSTDAEKAQLNKSNVTVVFYVMKEGNPGSNPTSGTFSGQICIDGSYHNISKKINNYYWGSVWKEVGRWTKEVEHNPDGTRSVYLDGDSTQSGTTMAGYYIAGGTVNLDTINRGPEIAVSSYDIYQDMAVFYVYSTNVTPLTDVLIAYSQDGEIQMELLPVSDGSVTLTGIHPNTYYSFSLQGFNNTYGVFGPNEVYVTGTTLPSPIDVSYITYDWSGQSDLEDYWHVNILANLRYGAAYGNNITDLERMTYIITKGSVPIATKTVYLSNYTSYMALTNLQPNTTYTINIQVNTRGGSQSYYIESFTTGSKPDKLYIHNGINWQRGLCLIKTADDRMYVGQEIYIKTGDSTWTRAVN